MGDERGDYYDGDYGESDTDIDTDLDSDEAEDAEFGGEEFIINEEILEKEAEAPDISEDKDIVDVEDHEEHEDSEEEAEDHDEVEEIEDHDEAEDEKESVDFGALDKENTVRVKGITNTSSYRIPDGSRLTKPIMTKYEFTKMVGIRAQHLSQGAKPVSSSIVNADVMSIAENEVREKKLPYVIKRPIGNGKYELWSLKEFEMINIDL